MDPPRQDTFTESVSTLLERKVRGWLSGVLDDMRRSSPVHVQNWLNSLPETPIEPSGPSEQLEVTAPDDDLTEGILSPPLQGSHNGLNTLDKVEPESKPSHEDKNLDVPSPKDLYKRKSLESGVLSTSPRHEKTKNKLQRDYSVQSEGYSPRLKNPLFRDASLQSDGSGSSGSSVLNVLGARKVDAESVLLELGFGPSEKYQKHQRIPERFLVPSKLKGISTEQFIKEEQHSMRMHDCGVFGYRGLTGNPHVPPSTIVAKIMDCILQDDVCREQASIKERHSVADLRSSAYTQLAARLLRDT